MEILILQYGLAVLFCLGRKNSHSRTITRRILKIPYFTFLCGFVLLFVAGYMIFASLDSRIEASDRNHAIFIVFNIITFLLVPAGFLFLRKELHGISSRAHDLLHLLPVTAYFLFFVVPVIAAIPSWAGQWKSDAELLRMPYAYAVMGIYILFVGRILFENELPAFFIKKRLRVNALSNGKGAPDDTAGVQVGTVHLDGQQVARMDTLLKEFFDKNQPYLKRGYSLKQLSADTAIPVHHLSAFINQYYHTHFNDFINEYRVHYCQIKIKNDEWRSKTLEAIAEESGFNNRNTFTGAFKKVTGCNPSDFLKSVKEHSLN